MKGFDYVRPQSLEAAAQEKKNGAVLMAGGSDLMGELKGEILPEYPEKVVSLKGIPGIKGIRLEDGMLKIGAMTTLTEIVENPQVKSAVPALAEAAHSVATPLFYFRRNENRKNTLYH